MKSERSNWNFGSEILFFPFEFKLWFVPCTYIYIYQAWLDTYYRIKGLKRFNIGGNINLPSLCVSAANCYPLRSLSFSLSRREWKRSNDNSCNVILRVCNFVRAVLPWCEKSANESRSHTLHTSAHATHIPRQAVFQLAPLWTTIVQLSSTKVCF